MMTTLSSIATSVTASSTNAVKDDRLVQSLTPGQLREETFLDQRSKSVPDDTDGSFVKGKIMLFSEKHIAVIIVL